MRQIRDYEIREKATRFSDELRQWAGDSPLKALAFGLACFALGWLANVWTL